ncbi:MAG: hypothetical protein ACOC6G_04410 [Thermoproteota archaeon]
MVKSSPHTLGRARERYVMQKYQEHGWNAIMMSGSAWGAKGAGCQPVDIKAFKLIEMTGKDWKRFFEVYHDSVRQVEEASGDELEFLLKDLIKSFLEWKEVRDRRNTITHYIQVKKDKDWLTNEERRELVRLCERDGAVPVFVYSYEKNKRLRRYKFENVKTGVVFSEKKLG